LKKWQYLLYKHVLLHGLNISVALNPDSRLIQQPRFQLYWLNLNLSYVLEFFLQSLVKKHYIKQFELLFWQQVLMSCATLAAGYVLLQDVLWSVSIVSLIMNLVHRRADFVNTGVLLGCIYVLFSQQVMHLSVN
jgi:hypothetical protein